MQVHHGLDGDLGAGDGEPFADGVGGEGVVVVLEAGEVEAELPGVGVDLGGTGSFVSAEGGFRQVEVEDDLAGVAGWSRRPLLAGARRCSTT